MTLLGVYLVNRWWKKSPAHSGVGADNLDVGQTVVLESWTDQSCGMARVKYRGTSWDAKVIGTAAVNDTLVIRALLNGAMEVSSGK